MTEILTRWYSSKVKPVRSGVYNVSCKDTDQSGTWYAYFDGMQWYLFAITIESAHYYFLKDCHQQDARTVTWRGIYKEPT